MNAHVHAELHRSSQIVPLPTWALSRYDTAHGRRPALHLSWIVVANKPEVAS